MTLPATPPTAGASSPATGRDGRSRLRRRDRRGVNFGNGKTYFFKGDQYLATTWRRSDRPATSAIAGNWPGLAKRLRRRDRRRLAQARRDGPGAAGGWRRRPRLVLQRPDLHGHRHSAFELVPGVDLRDDYLGHGKEIFNFVITDGRSSGRRTCANEGTLVANTTGQPTGVRRRDFGSTARQLAQLMISDREAGYNAIAAFCADELCDLISRRRSSAMPASDGNDSATRTRCVAPAYRRLCEI